MARRVTIKINHRNGSYISRYSPPFNNALSLFHSLQSNNYSDFKVLNNNNNKTKYFIITTISQTTGSGLVDVFFVHSSKMADEEIVVAVNQKTILRIAKHPTVKANLEVGRRITMISFRLLWPIEVLLPP